MFANSRNELKSVSLITLAALCNHVQAGNAPWIDYVKSDERLVGDDAVALGDTQEKDYAWGDVNNDGWVDLIVARKQPFTSAGKRVNVLFLNEAGVLVDSTAEYVTAVDHDQIVTEAGWPPHTDYPVDEGFLTPTNDRDSVLVDLLNNGWLDLITAPAISDGDPKHMGHPRVYVNLANDKDGAWRGFRFENARIPAMLPASAAAGQNPRFSAVSAGDVTGDGYADLYFSDHDSSGVGGGANQPPNADFNDRLLINSGTSGSGGPGYFSDETEARFNGEIAIGGGQPFDESAMGWAGAIADVNGSGMADIIKLSTLFPPVFIAAALNDVVVAGVFDSEDYQVIHAQGAPYYFSLGDLNNNGRLDMVITDANFDRYLLNHSTNSDGTVNWGSLTLLPEQNGGFGSNSVIADLDTDGWQDIIIVDVAVDIPPCMSHSRTNIYRNTGASAPAFGFVNASEVIPAADRQGVFDVAAFDITGNGAIDLVFGRCTGTDVWINTAPSTPCPADLTGDGSVGVSDLLTLLGAWGANPRHPADLDGDAYVGVADLLLLLGQWGNCP